MLCLVLAASACAAEDDDEETAAGTDSGMASNTSPVTDATDPATMTSMDDEGTTDTPDDEGTGPGEDGASTNDPTVADDDGSDESTESGGSADDAATTGAVEGSSVFGTVTRTAAIAGGNDGIGTFYVGLLAECSQDAMSFGGNGVMIDVSAPDTPAVWQIDGVADGHYFLAGFLDDNGNADMMDPYADMGDLAAAEGFGPACLEITVAGDDVAAGQFVLNIAVPF